MLGIQPPRGALSTRTAVATLAVSVVTLLASCQSGGSGRSTSPPALLRIGWGQASATNPLSGLRQLSQLLVVEGLARTADDGRMLPSMAESWTAAADGRSLTAKLRPNMFFHNGAAADANAVVALLPNALRAYMGP